MQFTVRYWSALLPDAHGERRGTPRWLDYSIHPASKLGLHNAMLTVHDRSEILQAHGCRFECAVFVVSDEGTEKLSQETANALFVSLPGGEVKWLAIKEFLLPAPPPQAPADTAPPAEALPQALSEQLPLFTHIHTPYDDLNDRDETIHTIDLNT